MLLGESLSPPETKEERLKLVATMPTDNEIRISVSLRDPSVEEIPGETREEWVSRRKAAVTGPQQEIAELLLTLGAKDLDFRWLTNDIGMTVAVGSVSMIAAIPSVMDVHLDDGRVTNLQYTGLEARAGMRTEKMHTMLFQANNHSRIGAGIRQRVGIIEFADATKTMNSLHAAFRDTTPTGVTRVGATMNCRSGTCVSGSSAPQTHQHFTGVAAVAAGSVEEGQDPTATTQIMRLQRSGHAREAYILPYIIDSCDDITAAINHAVGTNLVDVINMSFGFSSQLCNVSYNCSNLNATITSAFNAGVLIVVAAGNSGAGCSLLYPSYRPEVLAVGALATPASSTTYNGATSLASYSSRGPLSVKQINGTHTFAAGMGLGGVLN